MIRRKGECMFEWIANWCARGMLVVRFAWVCIIYTACLLGVGIGVIWLLSAPENRDWRNVIIAILAILWISSILWLAQEVDARRWLIISEISPDKGA